MRSVADVDVFVAIEHDCDADYVELGVDVNYDFVVDIDTDLDVFVDAVEVAGTDVVVHVVVGDYVDAAYVYAVVGVDNVDVDLADDAVVDIYVAVGGGLLLMLFLVLLNLFCLFCYWC